MPDVSILIWHDFGISSKDLELVLVQVVWDEWATNIKGVEFYVGWMRGTFVCDKSLSKSLGAHVTQVCGTWYKNKNHEIPTTFNPACIIPMRTNLIRNSKKPHNLCDDVKKKCYFPIVTWWDDLCEPMTIAPIIPISVCYLFGVTPMQ
jgi:hypothetical protein